MSQISEFYAKITADTSGLQKGLAEANTKLNDLAKTAEKAGGGRGGNEPTGVGALMGGLKGLINPMSIATAAFGALTAFVKASIKEASESAKIDAKLGAVIKSTGGAAGITAKQIDLMATSKSRMTGVDDELLKNSSAVMLTFTQIGKEVFPDAMQSAIDMSAVLGTDLQGSVIQLGKALNVTAGDVAAANMGMTALRRSGVSFTEEQKKLAIQMVETGDVAGYQKLILAELSKEFGGAAQAMFEAGDKSEAVKNSWGNFMEAMGNRWLPTMRNVNTETANMIDEQTANTEASTRAAEAAEFVRNQYGMTADEMRHAMAGNKEFREQVHNQANEYLRLQQYASAWENTLESQGKTTEQVNENYAQLLKGSMALTSAQQDYKDGAEKINEAISSGNYLREQYKAQQAELKKQLDEGTISQREYDAAAVKMYQSWADGTFKAKEQAKAFGELEAAQDQQGASFLLSLLGQTEGTEQLQYEFAAASKLITKEAASQYKAIDKIGKALQSGALDADSAAKAVQMVTGNLEGLNGLSVESFVDVYIKYHGQMPTMTINTLHEQTTSPSGGGDNRGSPLMGGFAEGGKNIKSGIHPVGERGEEGMTFNPDGSVNIIPNQEWKLMKKWGVTPDIGYATGIKAVSAAGSLRRGATFPKRTSNGSVILPSTQQTSAPAPEIQQMQQSITLMQDVLKQLVNGGDTGGPALMDMTQRGADRIGNAVARKLATILPTS